MAEETTFPESSSNSSDLLRKIVAAVVGIIVIILIVLAAKWIGDRVRDRFFPISVTPTPTPVVTITPTKVPTYSNIPATGPEDFAYILVALMGLGGISALAFSKKN